MLRRSIALVFALVLLGAACSTSDSSSDTTGTSGSSGAASGDPIVIGFPADLTTDWAYYDSPMQEGAQFAVDQINANGGVLGRPLEVVSRDDNGTPGDAVRVAEELTSREKVSMLIKEGFAGDEIIALGRKTADNLIAMCSHGRSGVRRFVLGSVTETVVRHSGDPVLVVRAK